MLYLADVAPLASTSSLPTFTRPLYCSATASTVGANARHGPHHAAQKSINTGTVDLATSESKFASVISIVLALMFPPALMNETPKVAKASWIVNRRTELCRAQGR